MDGGWNMGSIIEKGLVRREGGREGGRGGWEGPGFLLFGSREIWVSE